MYRKKKIVSKKKVVKKSSAMKLVKAEVKMADFVNSVAVTLTGTVVTLNTIAGGSSVSQRIGNQVSPSSITGRMHYTISPLLLTTFVRVMFVVDQQQLLATTPAVTDILASASTISSLNISTKGRFKILSDRTIVLDVNNPVISQLVKIPLKHKMKWSDATNTNIQNSGVYMLLLSDIAVNFPIVDYNLRLSWTDL